MSCAQRAACRPAAERTTPADPLARGAPSARWPGIVLLALASCAVELRDAGDNPSPPDEWAPIADTPERVTPVEPVVQAPARGLIYRSSNVGCFHQLESHEAVDLSAAEMADLRAVVQASRAAQSLDLRSLGITPERLDIQKPVAVSAITQALTAMSGAPRSGAELSAATRQRVADWLTLDYVTAAVQRQLTNADRSTSHADVRVELTGEPTLVLSSQHGAPWMLPWRVVSGTESWETYSTELPRALARYLPASVANHALLDGGEYWRDRFWKETYGWLLPLTQRLQREEAKRVAEALPGYARSRTVFMVEDASIGLINSHPLSLHLTLNAIAPQPVDAVWWFNLMGARGPRQGWPQLLEQYSSVNRSAGRFDWLKDWKSLPGQRSVGVQIVGSRPYEERDLDTFVNPAWKHAGLPGAPSIELILLREQQETAHLFLSEATRGVIIVSANPRINPRADRDAEALPASEHWLDVESVSFHPTHPTYLSVDALGQFERKTIPDDFPPLRRVLDGHRPKRRP